MGKFAVSLSAQWPSLQTKGITVDPREVVSILNVII